jgi:hypothetical protein
MPGLAQKLLSATSSAETDSTAGTGIVRAGDVVASNAAPSNPPDLIESQAAAMLLRHGRSGHIRASVSKLAVNVPSLPPNFLSLKITQCKTIPPAVVRAIYSVLTVDFASVPEGQPFNSGILFVEFCQPIDRLQRPVLSEYILAGTRIYFPAWEAVSNSLVFCAHCGDVKTEFKRWPFETLNSTGIVTVLAPAGQTWCVSWRLTKPCIPLQIVPIHE